MFSKQQSEVDWFSQSNTQYHAYYIYVNEIILSLCDVFIHYARRGVFRWRETLLCESRRTISFWVRFLHQVKGRYFQNEFLAEKTLKQLYILLSPFNHVIICDPDWGAVYLWGLIKQIGQSWWMMHLTDQNIQREYLTKHAHGLVLLLFNITTSRAFTWFDIDAK